MAQITLATADVLHALFEAFNRHDVETIVSLMTTDCVFDAAVGPEVHGTRYIGRDAVGAAFAQVWKTFPNAQWADARHFVAGERGVSEWIFKGTRADGARIEAEGCDLFTFRDGKIAIKKAFRKERPLLPPKTA